jgi:hypothetical protein
MRAALSPGGMLPEQDHWLHEEDPARLVEEIERLLK